MLKDHIQACLRGGGSALQPAQGSLWQNNEEQMALDVLCSVWYVWGILIIIININNIVYSLVYNLIYKVNNNNIIVIVQSSGM